MSRASTRQPRKSPPPGPAPHPQRPYIPFGRLLLLPVVAFLIALAVQAILRAAGLSSTNPVRVFLTPLIAAAVVFLGLGTYSTSGRLRIAIMVAVALFLFALLT